MLQTSHVSRTWPASLPDAIATVPKAEHFALSSSQSTGRYSVDSLQPNTTLQSQEDNPE